MAAKRTTITYQAPDGSVAVQIDLPIGAVLPETIELHRTVNGPVTFYRSDKFPKLAPLATDALTREMPQ